ncbi:hypothetical protein CEE36_05100 [candidate division TA06 bacterium B3_TA06]|uniref:Secretion system C-terminal sorting domain-containing protein n=1 Tax=candidate division TA06 bacterium B3_TA06 TaxID=2012487 RepID=A0A532V7F0_UNCT6|nr:MAG: hypothetical protein CEE36_05100 [candidate division TA06 bacterium B3_TA06]
MVDEVYLHATRMIITGAEENPSQPSYELSDVILPSSGLYSTRFDERGTLTLYEGRSGRRVRRPMVVHGDLELDLSDLPAGVYFGIYRPEEGRQQAQKIIKR